MSRFNFYVFFHIIFFVTLCRAEESEKIPALETKLETKFLNKLVPSTTHADILTAVQEFTTANPDVPPYKIVVSYDIDNTIFFEVNRIFSNLLIIDSIPCTERNTVDEHIYTYFANYLSLPTAIVDPTFRQTFDTLHAMGITLIATTARQVILSEKTDNLLQTHGVSFVKDTDLHIFPQERTEFKMPEAPESTFYFSQSNVLYTNGYGKGEVLQFLAKSAFVKPAFCIHIDDNFAQCRNIHQSFIENNTPKTDVAMTVLHFDHLPYTRFNNMEELSDYLSQFKQ